uniref:ribosomal protein L31 n=1 Tax=Sporochnus bolleanus TaxID=461143 RepID=UPI002E76C93E|nr:ribosomal protein L31 [Sporochnus bolleanus]WBP70355.1 ribosomal protein L31 [Sporochnus bolleanus]
MRLSVKSKVFGSVLSDGSLRFLDLPVYSHRGNYSCQNIDIINHPVWAGTRPKAQTEIARFVGRFKKG